MKYFKIKDNKGYFCLNENSDHEIDKISKEHLLVLLDKAVDGDFEMDEYEQDKIQNKAHQIIYRNLHAKFVELLENKNRFRDESSQLYKEAIEKYCEGGKELVI